MKWNRTIKTGISWGLLGMSLSFLAGGMARGEAEIVLQKAVEIREGDTPEVLQRRVMEQAEWVILPQAVALFCQDQLRVEGRTVHILPPQP